MIPTMIMSWSKPRNICDGGSWYPYVVGLDGKETDKIAGRKARFFMSKRSEWEIEFASPQESQE